MKIIPAVLISLVSVNQQHILIFNKLNYYGYLRHMHKVILIIYVRYYT